MNKITVSAGVGFSGLLCLLFIGLKLTSVINWSWFWVVLPITWWIILLFLIAVIVFGLLFLAWLFGFSKQKLKIMTMSVRQKLKFLKREKLINNDLQPPWT